MSGRHAVGAIANAPPPKPSSRPSRRAWGLAVLVWPVLTFGGFCFPTAGIGFALVLGAYLPLLALAYWRIFGPGWRGVRRFLITLPLIILWPVGLVVLYLWLCKKATDRFPGATAVVLSYAAGKAATTGHPWKAALYGGGAYQSAQVARTAERAAVGRRCADPGWLLVAEP